MKTIPLAAVLAVALTSQAVRAENATGQFAVEGAGNYTCAAFLDARADKGSAEYQRLIGFVEGWLSAANRYEPTTFDLTPWHNAAAFDLILEAHCREHGADTVVSVVQRMVGGFRPIRVAQFSKLLEVGNANGNTTVYEAILKRSQAALRTRGLYSGEEDGAYDNALRDSFMAFQRSAGLEPTGLPDAATLWKLLQP